MSQTDEAWMRRALDLAEEAARAGEVPVGAVLVRGDEVIGAGFNQPILANDPSAHAEVVALRAAARGENNYRLPDTTLYVTIEPCTMCVGAMIHARVKRLVFGAREPRAGAVCSHFQLLDQTGVFNHRIEWTGGVLEEECGRVMSDFFQEKRKNSKVPAD